MTDLADLLRSRYAERRAIAEAASLLQYDPENGWGILDRSSYAESERRTWIAPHIGVIHDPEAAAHVVANNPAEALADLEAKTALLDDLLAEPHDANHEDGWYSCATITDGDAACLDDRRAGGPCDCGRDARVERRLRILARPFAGHTDCKEEWAA